MKITICRSKSENDPIEESDWEAVEWSRPNELPKETNGVIEGMTGQFQVMACGGELLVCDAHTFEEAQLIAATHKRPIGGRGCGWTEGYSE